VLTLAYMGSRRSLLGLFVLARRGHVAVAIQRSERVAVVGHRLRVIASMMRRADRARVSASAILALAFAR
jgi:hypothetical protein